MPSVTLTGNSTCNLLLENKSKEKFCAFRIQTNAPDRYYIHPSIGLVPALGAIVVKRTYS